VKARLAATAFAVLAAMSLIPSAAMAGEGLQYRTRSAEAAPGSTETATAPCPKGTHVLGGGGDLGAEYGSALLSHSYPYDGRDGDTRPDDGWKAKGSALDRFVRVSASAICAPFLPRYRRASFEVDPAAALTEVEVPCGGQLEVVSGGSQGPVAVRQADGRPVDHGASGDDFELGFDNVAGASRRVTGFAICTDAVDVSYAVAGDFAAPGRDRGVGSAQCPPGAPNVVGGGQRNGAPFGAARIVQNYRVPFASFTTWWVVLDNTTSSSFLFNVTASCIPDP
jgi:hypothetical protein